MNQTLTIEQIISAIKQMPQEDRRKYYLHL